MRKLILSLAVVVVGLGACATVNRGHRGQTRADQLELLAKNGELLSHHELSPRETIAVQRQGYRIIKWRLSDYTDEVRNVYGGKIGTEERSMAEQLYIVDTNLKTCVSGQAVTIDCKTLKKDKDLAPYIK